MNWLDVVLILPILWAIWKGWKRGFLYEIIMFLSIFAAIYIAIHFSDYAAEKLKEHVGFDGQYAPIVSFAVTFLLVVFGFFLLAKVVSGLINATPLEMPNRVGGSIFSLAKTLLLFSILFIFLIGINSRFNVLPERTVDQSMLAKPIYEFSLIILPAIEESDFYSKMKEKGLIMTSAADTSTVVHH